jgi:hypothetical protein
MKKYGRTAQNSMSPVPQHLRYTAMESGSSLVPDSIVVALNIPVQFVFLNQLSLMGIRQRVHIPSPSRTPVDMPPP